MSEKYLKWIHREFCTRLPPEMLVLSNARGSKQIQIVPGEWRTGDVIVGRHIPISAPAIDSFINRVYLREEITAKRLLHGSERVVASSISIAPDRDRRC